MKNEASRGKPRGNLLRRGKASVCEGRKPQGFLAKQGDIQWACSLVARFARQKIMVVGDMMLDRYIYGTATRISPEAPVPVVQVDHVKNMPGGAANVARNVCALGGCVYMRGVVGRDAAGNDLLQILKADHVGTRGILRCAGLRTIVKTRILAERQQVVRVDWEDRLLLPARVRGTFCAGLSTAMRGMSGVIIADYAKGAVGQDVVNAVMRSARSNAIPVALDPKENDDLQLPGLTVATPNRKEAFALARLPEQPPCADPLKDQPLLRVAAVLLNKWKPAFLLITLGGQGMLLVSRNRPPRHVAAVAREVFDVSGAGDTVIAALLLALSAGADYETAAEMANCAAGVVVGKLGTATCTGRELLDYLNILPMRHGLQNCQGTERE
ncbi:MAG: PfkB family carbohydrate kinase [Verrucomicrobiota bacterium]